MKNLQFFSDCGLAWSKEPQPIWVAVFCGIVFY
jgi:hypothetical protein